MTFQQKELLLGLVPKVCPAQNEKSQLVRNPSEAREESVEINLYTAWEVNHKDQPLLEASLGQNVV